MKVKEESEKADLKFSIQKTKIMASSPITLWQRDGKNVETVSDFIFWGSKINAHGDCSQEIKRCLLFGSIAITKLDSIKKQSHHFANKSSYSQVWCATVHGVAKSWTQLSDWTTATIYVFSPMFHIISEKLVS